MDDDDAKKLKLMLVVSILFISSAIFSWTELKYVLFGRTADAIVTRVQPTSEYAGRGRSRRMLAVEYQFTEPGGEVRRESDRVNPDWPLADDRTAAVQYIAGKPEWSRLKGHNRMFSVYIFLACLVAMAIGAVQFWRYYKSK